MHQLEISIPVKAPGSFALAFLNTYVRDRADVAGQPRLRLRLPLTPLAGGTMLERSVCMQVAWIPSEPDAATQLAIGWKVEDSPWFPSFEGTLTALPDSATSCLLTIRGRCRTPLDAFFGRYIARASVRDLLGFFRATIEADYHQRVRSY